MGFCSLQHIRNPRSTCRGPSQPAKFRLQGLATLLTAYSLESRASFVSHRQRSWDSPFGGFLSRQASTAFRPGRTHVPLAQRYFRRRSVRPARRASVSGSTPARIALRPRGVLARQSPAPPLGFAPLGLTCEDLAPDFSRTPLACFTSPGDYSPGQLTPQSISQPSPCLTRPIPEYQPAGATLMGFLHLPAPDHLSLPVPGLWNSPLDASHITADLPSILGHRKNPAEAVQDRPWVPSIATFTSHPYSNTNRPKMQANPRFFQY
jgi:hypothetical protein